MQSNSEITPPCGVPLTLRLTIRFCITPARSSAPEEFEQVAVDDPFLYRRHQPVVRDRLETVGDVRLDHPTPAPEALIKDELKSPQEAGRRRQSPEKDDRPRRPAFVMASAPPSRSVLLRTARAPPATPWPSSGWGSEMGSGTSGARVRQKRGRPRRNGAALRAAARRGVLRAACLYQGRASRRRGASSVWIRCCGGKCLAEGPANHAVTTEPTEDDAADARPARA